MAITLSTAFGPEALRNVQIIASDVNPHALATAQRGIYGPWSFRGAGRMVRTRFFRTPGSGETFEILSPIREAVHFKHATLEAQLLELEPSSIDVIFFRNVAIYLSEAALGRVYAGMARVLREDGLLMIGPADPFPNVRELARSRVLDALVHRKRSLGRRSSRAPAAVRARPRASIRPVARSVRRTKQAAKAPCAALSRAQLLADRGLISDALLLIDAQLAQQGRNAERLALRGRIRLAAGDANGCVDDLREALSLDPSQLLLRFYYALGLEASQRTECCRSQLLELLGGLGARSDADTLGDDQATTTVGSIRKAAHELLRRVE